eukprot:jgi/Botrbrau1/1004/Bobra.114_1s0042.1
MLTQRKSRISWGNGRNFQPVKQGAQLLRVQTYGRRPQNIRPFKVATVAAEGTGQGVVFVPYTVVAKKDEYSLRLLEAHTAAVTEYERRDEGFLSLGAYFDGGNEEALLLAESQPVIMSYYPTGRKTMQLHVGLDRVGNPVLKAPQPTVQGVTLEAAGGELVAVGRFEGVTTAKSADIVRRALIAALANDGVELAEAEREGFFRLAQYGPLNSLSPRFNEIILRIAL